MKSFVNNPLLVLPIMYVEMVVWAGQDPMNVVPKANMARCKRTIKMKKPFEAAGLDSFSMSNDGEDDVISDFLKFVNYEEDISQIVWKKYILQDIRLKWDTLCKEGYIT